MEIKLHFPPEMPARSCEVVGFHYCIQTGHITTIISTSYSKKYNMFCMYDDAPKEYYEEHAEGIKDYSESIIAWAYMDEVTEGVFDEIHG